MSFLVLPPELNSALMFSGAGSGPLLDAAAAWEGLASDLGTAASSFSSVTSGLAGQAWQGRRLRRWRRRPPRTRGG
ncbi:PPE family protein [Mycobacterium kansasii 824]|nr:PPE family protein [Mycobacterium kansasii 824]